MNVFRAIGARLHIGLIQNIVNYNTDIIVVVLIIVLRIVRHFTAVHDYYKFLIAINFMKPKRICEIFVQKQVY